MNVTVFVLKLFVVKFSPVVSTYLFLTKLTKTKVMTSGQCLVWCLPWNFQSKSGIKYVGLKMGLIVSVFLVDHYSCSLQSTVQTSWPFIYMKYQRNRNFL